MFLSRFFSRSRARRSDNSDNRVHTRRARPWRAADWDPDRWCPQRSFAVKFAIYTIALTAVAGLSLVGCNNKKTSSIPSSESVADISPSPAPAPMSAYQPAAQPVAQPVVYDNVQANAGGAGGAIGGGSYTVKRGDTLYSIARSRYGDGKQWSKITAANPGLRPESLKV